MEEKKQFPPSLLILLVILLGVVVIFMYSNRSRLSNTPQETNSTPLVASPKPTQIPTFITLKTLTSQTTSAISVPLILQATADSHGQDVVGFDILTAFDQTAFTFVKAESPDPSFSVFAHLTPTHLSITGIKKTTIKTITPLSQSPILKLIFQPKKAGSFAFTVLPVSGRETTKLVNENSQIFNSNVEGISVQIK